MIKGAASLWLCRFSAAGASNLERPPARPGPFARPSCETAVRRMVPSRDNDAFDPRRDYRRKW